MQTDKLAVIAQLKGTVNVGLAERTAAAKHKPICRFAEIALRRGCLIVLDIDDTVLDMPNHLASIVAQHGNEAWGRVVTELRPRLTDQDFDLFLTRAAEQRCEVIFCSWRNPSLREATITQLCHVGAMSNTAQDLWLLDGGSKSQCVRQNYLAFRYRYVFEEGRPTARQGWTPADVIIVDDNLTVLDDFALNMPEAQRYRFFKRE